jgi:integrase/recombinase XerD
VALPVDTPIRELLVSWGIHLRAERKASRTIRIYAIQAETFAGWLTRHDIPAMVAALRPVYVKAFLADEATRVQSSTLIVRYKGLQQFAKWLVREGELEADPFVGLAVPKATEKDVPVLSEAELIALVKACAGTAFRDRRDEAIIRLMLETGCRIGEVAALAVDDVDLARSEVRLHGKGDRYRLVAFGPSTGRALDRYLRERKRHPYAAVDALWLGQRGRISRDGVDHLLRTRAEAAGLQGFHGHLLRHALAHRWLSAGGSELGLQKLAGWTSDAMLRRYASSTAAERSRDEARRLALGEL